MASFLAAGTAYANFAVPTIPFYIFYSIFGFQRVGDMIWAAGDAMARGFLLGGTSGRTTLNGEGLQHQDGHSQLLALTVPKLKAYDPAFAFELTVIIRDGIERMYGQGEDVFYYLTVTNQNEVMPALPGLGTGEEGAVIDGVLRGLYAFEHRLPEAGASAPVANLLGSGAIMKEVRAAAELLLAEGVAVTVWSVTSYGELARDGRAAERAKRLDPQTARRPYVAEAFENAEGVFVSASDYMSALGELISRWVPGPYAVLGTEGYGLSESRDALRDHFEVSAAWIAHAALGLLEGEGAVSSGTAVAFAEAQGLNLAKADSASY
jgi:pyruvate dehydrogenase E1 component